MTSLAMQNVSFHWLIKNQVIVKVYTFTSNMDDNSCTKVKDNLFSCFIQKNIYILMGLFQFSTFCESMILYITEYLLPCLFL